MATYPLDDKHMKYDLIRRQYYITPDGFKSYTGVDLGEALKSAEKVNAWFLECSDDVYEYIYGASVYQSIPYKRYKIAKDGEIREEFKRALLAQCRYAYRSSANLLKDQHGVNVEKGKYIDISNLRNEVGISKTTINILRRIGLLYSGFQRYMNLEDDGTY